MADIRWQSAIYGLLPLCEVIVLAWRARGDRRALLALSTNAVAGGAAFVIGFLPQMLAWNAIYGTFLAVSPIGPQIRFDDPHWVDVIWSSRNGLVSMSPILGAGALGFLVLTTRHRVVGMAFALSCAAMVLFNSMIQDWWGSVAYGGRRFDGAVPLLAVGLAVGLDAARRLIAARPLIPAAAVLAGAVVWNASFASIARRGAFDGDTHNDFGAVGGAQWRHVHARFGYPFSMPANLLFAWQNDVSTAQYDLLAPNNFFSEPMAPRAQIDFGGMRDGAYIGRGWLDPAADGSVTYRAGARHTEILFPLERLARFRFQFRLRAFMFDGAPPQRVAIRINDTSFGEFDLGADWQSIGFDVDPAALRTTVNRVFLTASRGSDAAPAGDGSSDPAFQPALQIDLFRIDRTDLR